MNGFDRYIILTSTRRIIASIDICTSTTENIGFDREVRSENGCSLLSVKFSRNTGSRFFNGVKPWIPEGQDSYLSIKRGSGKAHRPVVGFRRHKDGASEYEYHKRSSLYPTGSGEASIIISDLMSGESLI